MRYNIGATLWALAECHALAWVLDEVDVVVREKDLVHSQVRTC